MFSQIESDPQDIGDIIESYFDYDPRIHIYKQLCLHAYGLF